LIWGLLFIALYRERVIIAVIADGEMRDDFANDGRIGRMRATKGRS
jgi:hypothetical protein